MAKTRNSYNVAVGKQIATAREKAGRSQEWLADKCRRSFSTIRSIEIGDRGVSLRTFGRIAEALGVEAASLMPKSAHGRDGASRALSDNDG